MFALKEKVNININIDDSFPKLPSERLQSKLSIFFFNLLAYDKQIR